jgi:hypothetical protein
VPTIIKQTIVTGHNNVVRGNGGSVVRIKPTYGDDHPDITISDPNAVVVHAGFDSRRYFSVGDTVAIYENPSAGVAKKNQMGVITSINVFFMIDHTINVIYTVYVETEIERFRFQRINHLDARKLSDEEIAHWFED